DGQAGYLIQAAEAELAAAGVDEQLLAARGWNIKLNIDKKKQQQLEKAVEQTLLDELDPEKRKVDGHVQPGAVSVDPATGKVLAMYGGRDFVKHYINNATRQDYQPASTFKPIILAAALDTGAETQDGAPILPTTVYDGTSERPVEGSDTPFAPPNEDDVDYGPVSVQKAMNSSVNSVFAQMAVDVGLERTKQSAIELGLDAEAGGFDVKPAMSLGVMGASPLDMAAVYATLDNHGEKVTPRIIASAERDGQEVELPDPIGDQVVERETADTVTSVLQGVVNDGTASGIRSERLNFAGKTGTSDDNKSAWFAGYTPELVTTVGLFGEAEGGKQVTLSGAGGGGRVNGGGYPAEIWSAYHDRVLGDGTAAEFDLVVDDRLAETPPPSRSPDASDEPDPTTSAPSAPPDITTPPPPTTSSPPPATSSPPPPDTSSPAVTLPVPEGEPDRPGRDGERTRGTG
ncbi:penicillin-binding transpeptidase domain-containing protein, partial [Streptomyces sp. NPDC048845]|uniref:transglycosylase domain-containing protein n=1 Tax=Streptomyces sp. NPDC048845 TaxID=3155390 RepID=UPI00341926B8